MALTYANTEILGRGRYTLLYTEITMDNSYATGGETVTPASLGLNVILGMIPVVALGYNVEYIKTNPTAGLLKVWAWSNSTNTSLEIGSGTALNTVVVTAFVLGR